MGVNYREVGVRIPVKTFDFSIPENTLRLRCKDSLLKRGLSGGQIYLCAQNANVMIVKTSGIYRNRWASKG